MLLGPTDAARPWPAALVWGAAFGVGLAAWTTLLFVASLLGAVPRPWFAALALPFVLALGGRRLGAGGASAALPPGATALRWTPADFALAAAAILLWLSATAQALVEPVAEWDVLAIWGLKGRILAAESVAASPYFHDLTRAYSHLDYPLGWPFALSWIWSFTGADDLLAVKWLAPATLAALLAALAGALAARIGRRPALAATAAVAAIPMLAANGARLLADTPLALHLLLFALALAGARAGDRRALRLAAWSFTGLVTTKNEGLLLALVFAAAWAVAGRRREAEDRPVPHARKLVDLAPALGAILWLLFRATLPRVHANSGEILSAAALGRAWDHFGETLRGGLGYLANPTDWLLFWPLVAAALLAGARQIVRRRELAATALALATAALAYAVVLAGHDFGVATILEQAGSRLALQLAPAAAWLAAAAAFANEAAPAADG